MLEHEGDHVKRRLSRVAARGQGGPKAAWPSSEAGPAAEPGLEVVEPDLVKKRGPPRVGGRQRGPPLLVLAGREPGADRRRPSDRHPGQRHVVRGEQGVAGPDLKDYVSTGRHRLVPDQGIPPVSRDAGVQHIARISSPSWHIRSRARRPGHRRHLHRPEPRSGQPRSCPGCCTSRRHWSHSRRTHRSGLHRWRPGRPRRQRQPGHRSSASRCCPQRHTARMPPRCRPETRKHGPSRPRPARLRHSPRPVRCSLTPISPGWCHTSRKPPCCCPGGHRCTSSRHRPARLRRRRRPGRWPSPTRGPSYSWGHTARTRSSRRPATRRRSRSRRRPGRPRQPTAAGALAVAAHVLFLVSYRQNATCPPPWKA